MFDCSYRSNDHFDFDFTVPTRDASVIDAPMIYVCMKVNMNGFQPNGAVIYAVPTDDGHKKYLLWLHKL